MAWLKLMEEVLASRGGPEKVLRSDDEVAEIKAAQAQAAAKDEKLEDAERISKIASEQSKTIEPGSGFDKVLESNAA